MCGITRLIWWSSVLGTGMALHQDLRRDHRQPPASVTCLACSRLADGSTRGNGQGQNISQGALAAHSMSSKHLNYLTRFYNLQFQGPLAQPCFVQNAPPPPVDVFRCIVCSTSPTGYRRFVNVAMGAVDIPGHLASAKHLRRSADGRMQLYAQLHPQPGVVVPGLDAF